MSSNTLSQSYSFSPAQIQGCQLWLDGADPFANGIVPTNGSTIGTWINKGSASVSIFNSGTPTFSNAIINNLGAIRFPGSAYLQDNSFSLTLSNKTYYLVTQGVNSANGSVQPQGIMYFGNSGNVYDSQSGIAYQGPQADGFNNFFGFLQGFQNGGYYYSYGTSFSNTPLAIYEDTCLNTSASLYVNGSNVSNHTLSYTPQNSTGFRMGRRVDSLGQYYDGYICEVIAFSRVLGTAQRQQIEGYLAWKWGIQGTLIASHPFRDTPPFANNPSLPPSLYPSGPIRFGASSSAFSFFNPTSVTGCSLWLDGFDPNGTGVRPANNTSLSTWVDKSSFRNNGTASGTTGIFQTDSFNTNYPSVFFNVSKYGGTYPTNTGTTVTGFYVGRASASAGNFSRFISLSRPGVNDFDQSSVTAMLTVSSDGNKTFRTERTGSVGVNYTTSSVANVIANVLFDGTNCLFYANGSLVTTTASSGSFNLTQYGIGAGTQDTGQLIGNVAEIILFNSAVSTSERQQIEGYLAWKWGLQGNLPSNHPYKNAPPGLTVPSIPLTRQLGNRFWSPTSLTGCQLWLDAADASTVLLSGSSVSQWNDKSGNGYNATQATGSASYSARGIGFTGSQAFQTSLSSVNNTQTLFAVVSFNSSNRLDIVGVSTSDNASGYQYAIQNNIQDIARYGGGIVVTGGTVTQNTTFLYGAIVNGGSTSFLYVNGTQSGTAGSSLSVSGTGTVFIGGYRTLPANIGEIFSGTMNEIILYYSILSTPQRQRVEGYLAWKWGLVASLPAGHPWKLFPPPPA